MAYISSNRESSFWGEKKKLKRVEENLGQHCQTSNTLSKSRGGLEKEEEDLHTARAMVVSPARSKPALDPSTALRCWICEHLITETQTLELGEPYYLAPFPSPPLSLPALQCYSP